MALKSQRLQNFSNFTVYQGSVNNEYIILDSVMQKVSVVNLFNLSPNAASPGGGDWMAERYLQQQKAADDGADPLSEYHGRAPEPTFISSHVDNPYYAVEERDQAVSRDALTQAVREAIME